jgi:alginate O-acetyltransferase complex protein AlgI
MLFNSFEFVVFLVVIFAAYWLVLKNKPKLQTWLLLVGSCVFYMFLIPEYILILLITILIDYFAGLLIARSEGKRRRIYLIGSIISTCLVLFIFKYCNFFISNWNAVAQLLGWHYSLESLQILLPIGLSFHTFQSLSYVIEVYRRKQEPEPNFVVYSLYVMYFPQLVAGPIERASNLLSQFKRVPVFDRALAIEGLHQIVWGMFKKVVIADVCSQYVNASFEHMDSQSGLMLWMGAVAFSFQIYGDFSGYSDIALGTSKLFGVRLMQNFNLPYFALGISDFWRRWHISLSTWFRDYVYFPLGGSRVTGWLLHRNIFVIFLLSGFWHGANWTFVVWGGIHASLYSLNFVLSKVGIQLEAHNSDPRWRKVLVGLFTFFCVTLAWVFFRAKDVSEAVAYLNAICTQPFWSKDTLDYLQLCFLIVPFVIFEWINRRNENHILLYDRKIHPLTRFAIELVLVCLIVDAYYTIDHGQFIYFQF